MRKTEVQIKKIAIIGLPNTGKSQVFNNLTKQYTLVSNYPLTTIEMKKTRCKIGNQIYEIIDTPGLHCLYIHSEEELIVRDMIFFEKPDVMIQCIDANRLRQSLTLTADLLELGIPLVISLNAIDETSKKGIWIDSIKLSALLRVPVVESIAISNLGTENLKDAIAISQKTISSIKYGEIIEKGISVIESIFPKNLKHKRKLAILLLLKDPFLEDYLKKIYGDALISKLKEEIERVTTQFGGNLTWFINKKRNLWISGLVEKITRKQKKIFSGFSQTFAQLSRHPTWGIPIFLGVVFIMYLLVVDVANGIAGWMDTTVWVPIANKINVLVPSGFWNEFLIGNYGVLSLGLANAFLTVLPILSVFFLAFNILEDVGYIPNLCVLSKKIFEKLGLSGNAIMPLVLGFGCKTMATLATKSIKSKKEKYIAIYMIAFAIPCAAQMGLNMSILGRIGFRGFIIAFFTLAFVEILAGITLNKVIKEQEKRSFIQELPPIRLPNPIAVLKKTYYRLLWFLKEAVPVFIAAAVALFAADKLGILNAIKNVLSPVMKGFLGLPLEMVDALILCMARQEAAAGLIIRLVENGQLNYRQCIVAVTITTMFVPCFANIVAMIKELGAKQALTMAVIINVSSFLLSGALNWILIWTIGY